MCFSLNAGYFSIFFCGCARTAIGVIIDKENRSREILENKESVARFNFLQWTMKEAYLKSESHSEGARKKRLHRSVNILCGTDGDLLQVVGCKI